MYVQSRNSDADMQNMCMDRKRGRGGMNWEIGTDIYKVLTLCIK